MATTTHRFGAFPSKAMGSQGLWHNRFVTADLWHRTCFAWPTGFSFPFNPLGVTMSPQDVLKLVAEQEVKFVDFRFTDTRGKEQHVSVPAKAFDQD
jgi:hypothetical protein